MGGLNWSHASPTCLHHSSPHDPASLKSPGPTDSNSHSDLWRRLLHASSNHLPTTPHQLPLLPSRNTGQRNNWRHNLPYILDRHSYQPSNTNHLPLLEPCTTTPLFHELLSISFANAILHPSTTAHIYSDSRQAIKLAQQSSSNLAPAFSHLPCGPILQTIHTSPVFLAPESS